ncbi:hypothetical protein LEP1GSC151_0565 [Leptospira interrogans serovar Grippotyphosa str. LT2186]|uniref:Uncharacterized protein n=1 Tax=Leptospira interrogans serovar Grippotyphosa str. LT2186 TaxID=1001599 RepID=M3I879_LEPIR|nr:hypothetical protein LEP1GSC151_0565 [Leptospira interrogans serovar Grippotyphosa str. LT2186]
MSDLVFNFTGYSIPWSFRSFLLKPVIRRITSNLIPSSSILRADFNFSFSATLFYSLVVHPLQDA